VTNAPGVGAEIVIGVRQRYTGSNDHVMEAAMARKSSVSPDFWTWEAVVDCAAMTRLLLIGLSNFADDYGVQPLRPRTIAMQVFPGDALDAGQVRAMIDELAARGLVRTYTVAEQDYVEIVDWQQFRRVGKRAKRRYPPDPQGAVGANAGEEKLPGVSEAGEEPPASTSAPDNDRPLQSPPDLCSEKERWRVAIEARLRRSWPYRTPGDEDPAETERCIGQWIANDYDLERDVMPAVDELCQASPYRPRPTSLGELARAVAANRNRHDRRLAAVSA
jgi:hypothetical protein